MAEKSNMVYGFVGLISLIILIVVLTPSFRQEVFFPDDIEGKVEGGTHSFVQSSIDTAMAVCQGGKCDNCETTITIQSFPSQKFLLRQKEDIPNSNVFCQDNFISRRNINPDDSFHCSEVHAFAVPDDDSIVSFTDVILCDGHSISDSTNLEIIRQDLLKPVITFTEKTTSANVGDSLVTEVKVTDDIGVSGISILYDDPVGTNIKSEFKDCGNLPLCTFSVSTTAQEEGLYTVTVYAFDDAFPDNNLETKVYVANVNEQTTTGCSDSDGGIKPNTKGVVSFGTDHEDSCVDTSSLTEYYCTNNELDSTVVECGGGCSDGACESSCSEGDVIQGQCNGNAYNYKICDGGEYVQQSNTCTGDTVCNEVAQGCIQEGTDQGDGDDGTTPPELDKVWVIDPVTGSTCIEVENVNIPAEVKTYSTKSGCITSLQIISPTVLYSIVGAIAAIMLTGVVIFFIRRRK